MLLLQNKIADWEQSFSTVIAKLLVNFFWAPTRVKFINRPLNFLHAL